MKLKTLKDLRTGTNPVVFVDDLKKEAIKWVREDLAWIPKQQVLAHKVIENWMERLNITEEDLK